VDGSQNKLEKAGSTDEDMFDFLKRNYLEEFEQDDGARGLFSRSTAEGCRGMMTHAWWIFCDG